MEGLRSPSSPLHFPVSKDSCVSGVGIPTHTFGGRRHTFLTGKWWAACSMFGLGIGIEAAQITCGSWLHEIWQTKLEYK